MEKVIRYLLAFMWFAWLLDHGSTVVGLNMGDFFVELNPLFDEGGWFLLIRYNFLLRCAVTAVVVVLYKIWPASLATAIYVAITGYLAVATLFAATGNVNLIAQLLRELGDMR